MPTLIGILLGLLAWFAGELSPVLLSVQTTAIMIMVAVWESISLGSGAAQSRPDATQSEATNA